MPTPAQPSKLVRLRPQNPFDLIRLLARSQSDPRKAVAELVQNSLDAGATRIEIEWFNEKGCRALRIFDDGQGVFPELSREEALMRIAKTIGHSRKRDLSPAQRREQMVLGKYGIGLIGFWSVGEVLEMRSRVGGGKTHVLRLREERASGEVFPARTRRVDDEETFTEVTIRKVHSAAAARIRPPRLQAFLANELRGQLLERGATVRIHDRVARGLARKEFVVQPRPYLGQALPEWRELEVPGYESVRLELYLVPPEEGRRGVVALSCGGTVVLDDMSELDGVDQPRAPWCNGQLEGVIDFPELYVAPGTRRGFVHDEPVAAFLAALEPLERQLEARLFEEQARRSERQREDVAKEIRRAFRTVAARLPDYDFFALSSKNAGGLAGGGESTGAREAEGEPRSESPSALAFGAGELATADGEPLSAEPEPRRRGPSTAPDDFLFAAGPLARLLVKPRRLSVVFGASRAVRALALDADGRPAEGPMTFDWSLEGAGELRPDGASAVYVAPIAEPTAESPERNPIRIRVRATQNDVRLEQTVEVALQDPAAAIPKAGIPEPLAVSAPGEAWRSRVRGDRWEYNEAHRDYRAVADVSARRLRYLIHLFAKEVVLRNFGRPGDDEVLERLVEVLTHLDQR